METHLEIGHHDDAPAGVRVPALASPAHRVDGGRAPASQSNSRTTVPDAESYIRGASEEDSDSATLSGATPLAISARFRVLEAPDAFVGPHARTRRRSTLDPALTAPRRHYAHPGGRDEHRQTKMAP